MGDWVTVGVVVVSTLVNACVYLFFQCRYVKHPVLRARGVHLLGLQTVAGTFWAAGSLASFEHIEDFRNLHASSCRLVFWATWVWGACTFISLLSFRLHRLYSTFVETEPESVAAGTCVGIWTHKKWRHRTLLIVHLLPPCIVALAAMVGKQAQHENGCVFPWKIKFAMMLSVWTSMAMLVGWLFLFKRVRLPMVFSEVRPVTISTCVAVPGGCVVTILIMSGAWRWTVGRCVITLTVQMIVNICLWTLCGRPLINACSGHREHEAVVELSNVHIGPFSWVECVSQPALRAFLWEYMRKRKDMWSQSAAGAHAGIVRYEQHDGMRFAAEDIIKRFVEPASRHNISAPLEIATPLLAFRFNHDELKITMFDSLKYWLLAEMKTRIEPEFVTQERAQEYYGRVARYEQALTSLERQGLLEISVDPTQ